MARDVVPMDLWGKDHWSALGFLETCVVDNNGVVRNDNMRVDARRHPRFTGRRQLMIVERNQVYPTRLRDNQTAGDHDDWDCLYDFKRLGFVKIHSPRNPSLWDVDAGSRGPIGGSPEGFGPIRVRISFTDAGKHLAAQLRIHKMGGHPFATFRPVLLPDGTVATPLVNV